MNTMPAFPNFSDMTAAPGMIGLGSFTTLLNYAHYAEIGLPLLLFSIFFFRYTVRAVLIVLLGPSGGKMTAHILDLVVLGGVILTFCHDPTALLRWAVAFGQLFGGPPNYG